MYSKNLQNKIYELKCNPTKSINAHLQGVYGRTNSNYYIIINFSVETHYLVIIDLNNENNIDNYNHKNNSNISNSKISSGKLSAGAIARIVITSVIILIAITTILYCLCKNPNKAQLQKNNGISQQEDDNRINNMNN